MLDSLVKCPMQETLAQAPLFDPPIDKFNNLYGQWAQANYGLIITGQIQIYIRCTIPLLRHQRKLVADQTYLVLSIAGDVVWDKRPLFPILREIETVGTDRTIRRNTIYCATRTPGPDVTSWSWRPSYRHGTPLPILCSRHPRRYMARQARRTGPSRHTEIDRIYRNRRSGRGLETWSTSSKDSRIQGHSITRCTRFPAHS